MPKSDSRKPLATFPPISLPSANNFAVADGFSLRAATRSTLPATAISPGPAPSPRTLISHTSPLTSAPSSADPFFIFLPLHLSATFGPMFEKRFYVEGLAHASYLIGDSGQAAVIDPKRDVNDYLETAQRENLKIVAILETHPHADFVSGHVELAQRTGAAVYVSHLAPVKYQHESARDGDVIPVGSLRIIAIETPGHSPDSVSFLVEETGKPVCIFTGDTLFAGDVG